MKKYITNNKLILFLVLISSTLTALGSAFISIVLSNIIDVSMSGSTNRFSTALLQAAVFILILAAVHFIYSYISKKFICKIISSMRQDVFEGVFRMDMKDFKKVNSADYLSVLTNDIKLIEENFLLPFLLSVQNIIIFIASFGIMLWLSPVVTLCLVVSLLLLIIVPALFQNQLQNRQENYSEKLSEMTLKIKDLLSGFDIIKSYRMSDYVRTTFYAANENTSKSKQRLDASYAFVESVSIILGVLVQCSVLFVSAWLILQGKITAGTTFGLITLSGSISIPIQEISQNLPKMQGTKTIIKKISDISSCQQPVTKENILPSFDTRIKVENLRFSYDNNTPVLNNASAVFEKDKKYAIVGKSGCGKSTLINLINGTYSEYSGNIYYDDKELSTLNKDKINELSSIIHQNVYMFDESILDNICLHKQYSEDQLTDAVKNSGVDMFLDDVRSLNTSVGENGSALSGGQKQRIAVARALIEKKPLMILDEGTSAIDQQTAYDIEHILLKKDDLTLITITHSMNPELLKNYDSILYMEDGKIIEQGHFEDLIKQNSRFSDFYHLKTA